MNWTGKHIRSGDDATRAHGRDEPPAAERTPDAEQARETREQRRERIGGLPPGVKADRRRRPRRERDESLEAEHEERGTLADVVAGTIDRKLSRWQRVGLTLVGVASLVGGVLLWLGFKNGQGPGPRMDRLEAQMAQLQDQAKSNGSATATVDAKLDSTRADFGLLAYVLCVSLTESSPQRVPRRCTAVLASERR
jgi:hypothetical protein